MRITYALSLLFSFASLDLAKASFNESTTLEEFITECQAKNIKKLAIVGCGYAPPTGNLNCEAHVHVQPAFYIDLNPNVLPNVRANICKEEELSGIPDETFDEIYLERIGGSALSHKNCFKNCLRILKKGGFLSFDEYPNLGSVQQVSSIPAELSSIYPTYKGLLFWSNVTGKDVQTLKFKAIEDLRKLKEEIGQENISKIEELMQHDDIFRQRSIRDQLTVYGLTNFRVSGYYYYGTEEEDVRPLETITNPYNNRILLPKGSLQLWVAKKKEA